MDNIKGSFVKMPFNPITLISNEMVMVGAIPQAGRTLYAIHLIVDNSIRDNDLKGLAYFVVENKRRTIRESGFGAMLYESQNVKLNYVHFGTIKKFINVLETDLKNSSPDYIVIDGLEYLVEQYAKETELINELDILLSSLRYISDARSIPIILTARILLNSNGATSSARPLICDFDSGVLQLTAKHTLTMKSPFYFIDNSEDGYNWSTMEISTITASPASFIPEAFIIEKSKGRFYSKGVSLANEKGKGKKWIS